MMTFMQICESVEDEFISNLIDKLTPEELIKMKDFVDRFGPMYMRLFDMKPLDAEKRARIEFLKTKDE